MLFNSFEFAIFLPLVFILYWFIGNNHVRLQNVLILIASYIFYGFWDWRFLFLILLSSLIDFYAAQRIYTSDSKNRRKFYLYFSLFWNFGILCIFKYYNFFLDNLNYLLNLQETSVSYSSLSIILPVGLSFYTFQTVSYTIDTYRGKIKPTNYLLEFLCFVSFFPQLVAGPIERASSLLPQFFKKRHFNTQLAKEGLRQILWGLFKKIVIADNLALVVNEMFSQPGEFQSLELFYALTLFYFQIYCDFSGYVDIALGSAKLLGFRLSINFKLPHFAKSIPDFWRRWNITLSVWFRDYVHIPFLKNKPRTLFNSSLALFLTFGLIGLWHGANWTFLLFGLIHAAYMIIHRIKTTSLKKSPGASKIAKKIPTIISIVVTFVLVVLSIVFFRAPTVSIALEILSRIFAFIPDDDFQFVIKFRLVFLFLLLILEYVTRQKDFPLQHLEVHFPRFWRWCIYYIFIFLLIRYGGPKESFIYFQF